jgi:hypothetical protein
LPDDLFALDIFIIEDKSYKLKKATKSGESPLKTKFCLFLLVLLLGLGFAALANAQTSKIYWFEQFSYYNVDQLKAAGWTIDQTPAGVSIDTGNLVMDGTKGGDALIRYHGNFPQGINEWKIECRSMWPGGKGHSDSSVFIITQNHTYVFAADGYYNNFAFYRDNKKILTFGTYQEKAGEWMTLAMVKQGSTISMYFNGELKNTYDEPDPTKSPAVRVDIISPWASVAYYDYYILAEPTAITPTLSPTETSTSFPIVPVVVGGGVTAAIIGGVLYYFYVIAGSNPAVPPPNSGAPQGGSPNTGPPPSVPPGTITAGGGPPGPPTAPFTAPTTAPFTAPTTAPGQIPATAPGTAPTTAPGQIPATAPGTTPTTSPGTATSTASQLIPNPPPLSINEASEIIGKNFQGIWQGKEVAKATIVNQLKNMGMNASNAQKVIDKLVEDGIIKLSKPGYYVAA